MNLKIGIVGLPNVGKSTLFNALTNAGALAANYPFATIEPNVGIVPVPDERLEVLAKMYDTEKVVPATVEFVDIAGLVEGASKGEGLGNKFLAHIRECQVICHVVRVFEDGEVIRAEGSKDPQHDIEIIQTELELADLETREKAEAKRKKNAGKDDTNAMIPYLTEKPVIYMFNVDEKELSDKDLKARLAESVAPSQAIFVNAKLEAEMSGMTLAERKEFLAEYGVEEDALSELYRNDQKRIEMGKISESLARERFCWREKAGEYLETFANLRIQGS